MDVFLSPKLHSQERIKPKPLLLKRLTEQEPSKEERYTGSTPGAKVPSTRWSFLSIQRMPPEVTLTFKPGAAYNGIL